MLTGLLFTEGGVRYIPTSADKSGRRYHYYTSQALIKGDKREESVGRLPAPTVEAAVAERIVRVLQSPSEILDAVKRLDAPDVNYETILKNAAHRASGWSRLTHSERADLIRAVLHRVIVHEGSIELQLHLESLVLAILQKALPERDRKQHAQTFGLEVPFRHIPQGNALKLVIENRRAESSTSREAIVKAIARARSWYELIVQGEVTGLPDLARQQGLTHRYVKNIFPLAYLGPESIELLLNCRDGMPRTLESLMGKVPMRWDAQKAYLSE